MQVVGKNGIKARVLKKSRSAVTGKVFTTYEIEYPRIILAELNTHRMLPKNSASSRAIPFLKMLEQLHGQPVRFGEANPGMQDKGGEHNGIVKYPEFDHQGDFDYYGEYTAGAAWESAKEEAIRWSKGFFEAGFHKQVYNRLTEPFQIMRTVISGTEWANFFWLRNHEAADPTLQELARVMFEADAGTEAEVLQPGEWHLPYIAMVFEPVERGGSGIVRYGDWFHDEFVEYALEDAIKVSCARCAAVSFRNEDYTLEKSKQVYDRLVGDERKHASAFEHCATPMQASDTTWFSVGTVNVPPLTDTWEPGITHMDRERKLWSGPLKGFIQYRKLIPGENYVG